jgi:hypothetical protein
LRSAPTTKCVLAAALLILLALGATVHADDPIAEWLKQDESDGQNDQIRPDLHALTDQQLQDIFKIGRYQADSHQLIERGSEQHPRVLYISFVTIAAGFGAVIGAVKAVPFVRRQLRTLAVMVQARIAEIMRVGAERAEVTAEEVIRELKKLDFSCIGKAVTWRNEVVTRQLEEGEEGEPKTVLVPRVRIVPTEGLDKATLDAIAEVSQQANCALRVKMHDKHGPLVSIGKHLGMFVGRVQIQERKQISAEPMSAEEWKRQFVREG